MHSIRLYFGDASLTEISMPDATGQRDKRTMCLATVGARRSECYNIRDKELRAECLSWGW